MAPLVEIRYQSNTQLRSLYDMLKVNDTSLHCRGEGTLTFESASNGNGTSAEKRGRTSDFG